MNRTLLLAASLALLAASSSARAEASLSASPSSSASPTQIDATRQTPAAPLSLARKAPADPSASGAAPSVADYSGVALAANDGNLGQYFLMLAFVALMTVLVEIAGRLLPQQTSRHDERLTVPPTPTVQPQP